MTTEKTIEKLRELLVKVKLRKPKKRYVKLHIPKVRTLVMSDGSVLEITED